MSSLKVRAPAKINLFLKILRKRTDGYHDIFSWFQAINLFDNLEFKKTATSGINLKLAKPCPLPVDDKNLIIQVARLMFKKFDLPGGLDIILEKNIPISAGLGGGSSDAAAAIHSVDRLYDLRLSKEEKREIGLEIGSDIPFFFSTGQAEITGRGEKIREIPLPVDYDMLLINSGQVISTASSYAGLKMGLTSSEEGIKLFSCKDFKDLILQISEIGNDFESNHLKSYPILSRIRDVLYSAGAVLARLSGTGPTMFGLFENKPEGDGLGKIIRGDWQQYWVKPITLPAWDR
jgi:4-diphosphocytidyl-2-C-methyl-D-erythritol kinase